MSSATHDYRMKERSMPSEPISRAVKPQSARHATGTLTRWARPLAIAAAAVFCVSSAFPLVAAFIRDTEAWPKWWGALDVGVAFVLALLALAVTGLTRSHVDKQAEDASFRTYRVLMHGIFALMVVFVLFGDDIIWSQCLPGFAWRFWLLCYCLPAWFTLARPRRVSPDVSAEG
jgi:VIT1/CCC1 family predicted Fe2+/Mn2+ transporter